MSRQRCGLGRNTLHQAAVAGNSVNLVIHNLVAGAIEVCGQILLRDTHAHAVAEALPQWSRSGFDSGHQPMLGMARGFASPLAELL